MFSMFNRGLSLHAQGDKVERQVERESSMDTDAPVTRGPYASFWIHIWQNKIENLREVHHGLKNNKTQRGRSLTRKPRSRSNSGQGRKISTTPNPVRSISFFSGKNSKNFKPKLQTKKNTKAGKWKVPKKNKKTG